MQGLGRGGDCWRGWLRSGAVVLVLLVAAGAEVSKDFSPAVIITITCF